MKAHNVVGSCRTKPGLHVEAFGFVELYIQLLRRDEIPVLYIDVPTAMQGHKAQFSLID